jgi:hypothetical protein
MNIGSETFPICSSSNSLSSGIDVVRHPDMMLVTTATYSKSLLRAFPRAYLSFRKLTTYSKA